jgi:hypothetical protein
MTIQLSFSVREDTDDETHKLIHYGTFSRDWAEEEDLDELQDSLDAGQISRKQALLRAQKLLLKFPGQLEIQNFIANRLWHLELRDEAADAWEKATGRQPPSSHQASRVRSTGLRSTIDRSCALPTAICWG